MEPDIFMIWEENPYFVEIQRSYYSPQKMRKKRYIRYYQSNEWQQSGNIPPTADIPSFMDDYRY